MNLEVSLSRRQGAFTLNADFSIEGDRWGIFGPSGSGKSTLMDLIAGLSKPDRGRVVLDGRILCDRERGIFLPPEERRVGVVFQHAHLFPHLGVRRNLYYGYRRTPAAERKIDPQSLIDVLEIGHLLDRPVNVLSGGERQRVALGRTILSCPKLILLDEPLTGIDDKLKYQIIPYLKRVFAEFAIPYLFISHSLNEMRLMSDNLIEFTREGVAGEMSTEEMARRRMGTSQVGYINLMELHDPVPEDGLYAYRWGDATIVLSAGGDEPTGMFELSSKDITLFKKHPEATSARNMLRCTVKSLFGAGNRVGVELGCGGKPLISQVVAGVVDSLELAPGRELYAVIKASAFRRLY